MPGDGPSQSGGRGDRVSGQEAGGPLRRRAWTLLVPVVALATAAGALILLLQVARYRAMETRLDAAAAAFAEAEQAGARSVATAAWQQAHAAMAAAMTALHRERERFVLVRSYGKVAALLDEAAGAAAAARDEARSTMLHESVKVVEQRAYDVAQTLEKIDATLRRVESLLTTLERCPRAPRSFAKDAEMVRGNLAAFRSQATSLKDSAGGSGFEARGASLALLGQVEALLYDLEAARAKMQC